MAVISLSQVKEKRSVAAMPLSSDGERG